MGNCLETCVNTKKRNEMYEDAKQEDEKRGEKINGGFVKETSVLRSEKGGNVRVKIVVTREELDWLMAQLNNKGGKSLEDFLGEIERGRDQKVGQSWKPSLESIMECPELLQEMHR